MGGSPWYTRAAVALRPRRRAAARCPRISRHRFQAGRHVWQLCPATPDTTTAAGSTRLTERRRQGSKERRLRHGPRLSPQQSLDQGSIPHRQRAGPHYEPINAHRFPIHAGACFFGGAERGENVLSRRRRLRDALLAREARSFHHRRTKRKAGYAGFTRLRLIFRQGTIKLRADRASRARGRRAHGARQTGPFFVTETSK